MNSKLKKLLLMFGILSILVCVLIATSLVFIFNNSQKNSSESNKLKTEELKEISLKPSPTQEHTITITEAVKLTTTPSPIPTNTPKYLTYFDEDLGIAFEYLEGTSIEINSQQIYDNPKEKEYKLTSKEGAILYFNLGNFPTECYSDGSVGDPQPIKNIQSKFINKYLNKSIVRFEQDGYVFYDEVNENNISTSCLPIVISDKNSSDSYYHIGFTFRYPAVGDYSDFDIVFETIRFN